MSPGILHVAMFGSDDERENRHVCVTCATMSPSTETNYTLISSQHGWRLSRGTDKSGRSVMEWRCPKCWAKYKASTLAK